MQFDRRRLSLHTPLAYARTMQIVRTKRYLRDLKRLKASIQDVEAMEAEIAAQPEAGVVIRGLKGVRKARFAIGNRGKSGGGRAIYYFAVVETTVFMLAAYSKSEKTDLSADDRKAILSVLEQLEP
jgi:hypothetical protein